MLTNPSRAALTEAVAQAAQTDEVLDWYDAQLTATLRDLERRLPSLRAKYARDDDELQLGAYVSEYGRRPGRITLGMHFMADYEDLLMFDPVDGFISPSTDNLTYHYESVMYLGPNDWIKALFVISICAVYPEDVKATLISIGKIEIQASRSYLTETLLCGV